MDRVQGSGSSVTNSSIASSSVTNSSANQVTPLADKGNIFSIFQWLQTRKPTHRLLVIHTIDQLADVNQSFTGNYVYIDDEKISNMRQWLSHMSWNTLGIGIERLTATVSVDFFKSVQLPLTAGKYIFTFFSGMEQRLVNLLLTDVTSSMSEEKNASNDDIITVFDTETGRVMKFPRIPIVSFSIKAYDMSWLTGR